MVGGERRPSAVFPKSLTFTLQLSANIIRFSQLRGLVNRYYSDERILEELPKVATLVRGCWVIRSSIIYRDRPAAARQMLLKLFNEQDYVTRQELIERARIPLQMATAMLQEIAVYVPNKGGWALRMGHDEEFLLQHEVLAAKLKASFERDVQNIEKELAPKPMQRRPSASGSRPAPASSAAALKKQASAEALKSGASTLTGPPVPPPLKSAASAAPAPKATATASSSASTPAPAATSAPAPKEKEKEKETEKEKDKGKAPAPVPVPDDVKVYEQNPVTTDAYPVEGASMHEQMRALVRQIFVKHGVVKEHVIKSYLWARANDACG